MGAALSGSPELKFLNAFLHTQLCLLKGLREGGGGLFHTCPHTQLLRRLKGTPLDSPSIADHIIYFWKALYLSVNGFSTKALIRDTIFTSPTGDGTATEPGEGLAICRVKAVPSLLSHFKTLSIGSVPGIEPATSRSAVKRSTNWANPASVKLFIFSGEPCFYVSFKRSYAGDGCRFNDRKTLSSPEHEVGKHIPAFARDRGWRRRLGQDISNIRHVMFTWF